MKSNYPTVLLTGILCLILAAMAYHPAETAQKPPQNDDKKETRNGKKEKPVDVDVTAQFREFNSNKYSAPPTKFRQGHVTPRKLPKEALTKVENGFVVQLPSKAPIPTPTFYKDQIFVSGGFHSKEYYCLNSDGEVVWGINLDDDGPSSCVCEDDICVFNTESCTIFAVDAKTGKHLWSHWLGDPLMSTPAIANGRVFTSYPAFGLGSPAPNGLQGQQQLQLSPKAPAKKKDEEKKKPKGHKKRRPPCSHVLACLDLKTGKILWQRWIDSDVMSAPVADGDELYASTFAGTVYKFDQKSGKILSAIKSRATSAPVIVGKDVYFTRRADGANSKVAEESISRVTRFSGKKIFDANKTRALHLDEAIQSKTDLAKKGQKLDADNGFSGGAPQSANPSAALSNIGQGGVYTCQAFQGSRILNHGKWNFNCQGDEFFCTDAMNGKRKWSTKIKGDLKKVGGSLAAPPIYAGGRLFLATFNGEVLQINSETGVTEKTYQVGAAMRTQPIIQNGNLYVGTINGKLVCIKTGNKKLTGWSTWGGNSAHTGIID